MLPHECTCFSVAYPRPLRTRTCSHGVPQPHELQTSLTSEHHCNRSSRQQRSAANNIGLKASSDKRVAQPPVRRPPSSVHSPGKSTDTTPRAWSALAATSLRISSVNTISRVAHLGCASMHETATPGAIPTHSWAFGMRENYLCRLAGGVN